MLTLLLQTPPDLSRPQEYGLIGILVAAVIALWRSNSENTKALQAIIAQHAAGTIHLSELRASNEKLCKQFEEYSDEISDKIDQALERGWTPPPKSS